MSCTKCYQIIRCDQTGRMTEEDLVVSEYTLNLFLNDEEFVSLLCTPNDLKALIIGFLHSEGIINTLDQLEDIRIDEASKTARITTKNKDKHHCSGNKLFESDSIKKQIRIGQAQILALAERFNKSSELFLSTGGVHSCALCNDKEILLFEDDIGRHNAMDKILGKAIMDRLSLQDKIVITSGRITEEMVRKVIRAQIPVLVSISAPTDAAIEMARNLNLTLIGFARGNRMNVYSNQDKISE